MGDMPDMDSLFGSASAAPVIPLPSVAIPSLPVPPAPAAAAPAGAPPKRPRKPADPNKPKAPRKRKEAPPSDGSLPGEPPAKKPRKKKEPEIGPDGQPIVKPKKPRKKKTDGAPGTGDKAATEGAASGAKPGAAGAGDEDDLGGDLAVDDELVAASTVKPKRGEDDEEEDDEEESSAEEGEQDQGIQLGSFNEAQDFQDVFSDAFLAPTEDDLQAQEAERAKVSKIMANFTADQMERYEAFRRSRLAAPAVRKVMNATLGFSVHHDCGIVMAGAAKLFVGEMIETARQVQDQWSKANGIPGPYGPLTPDCIREAYRRLKQEGKVPYAAPSRLFKR